MGHIAAGEHPGQGGLHVLVDQGPVGAPVQRDARLAGELIFGDEAHRQQQGVAVKDPLSARDGAALVVHSGGHHLFHPALPPYVHHGVGEVEGDVKVLQTLDNVAL